VLYKFIGRARPYFWRSRKRKKLRRNFIVSAYLRKHDSFSVYLNPSFFKLRMKKKRKNRFNFVKKKKVNSDLRKTVPLKNLTPFSLFFYNKKKGSMQNFKSAKRHKYVHKKVEPKRKNLIKNKKKNKRRSKTMAKPSKVFSINGKTTRAKGNQSIRFFSNLLTKERRMLLRRKLKKLQIFKLKRKKKAKPKYLTPSDLLKGKNKKGTRLKKSSKLVFIQDRFEKLVKKSRFLKGYGARRRRNRIFFKFFFKTRMQKLLIILKNKKLAGFSLLPRAFIYRLFR
jgi:hypothetical protein